MVNISKILAAIEKKVVSPHPTPNSYIESLTPSVAVFRDGASKEVIRVL